MKKYLFLTFVFLNIFFGHIKAQTHIADFSLWNWYQVNYNFSKKSYANLQWQFRLNENASQFDKSNFYFTYGRNFLKVFNAELLYQYTTNHENDGHTLYAGITYKLKIGKAKLYYRASLQHIRNYFSGDYRTDNPYTEFRNRIRISYPLLPAIDFTLSAEPYIKVSSIRPAYWSRLRTVAQMNYAFNRYHSISIFYLYEPMVFSYSNPHTDDVLGITYQLTLPKKLKKIKKIFTEPREKHRHSDARDTFQ